MKKLFIVLSLLVIGVCSLFAKPEYERNKNIAVYADKAGCTAVCITDYDEVSRNGPIEKKIFYEICLTEESCKEDYKHYVKLSQGYNFMAMEFLNKTQVDAVARIETRRIGGKNVYFFKLFDDNNWREDTIRINENIFNKISDLAFSEKDFDIMEVYRKVKNAMKN